MDKHGGGHKGGGSVDKGGGGGKGHMGKLHAGGHEGGGSVNDSPTRKGTPAQPHPGGHRTA